MKSTVWITYGDDAYRILGKYLATKPTEVLRQEHPNAASSIWFCTGLQ
jgi:hypothetical protein